jgi:hypothetical protein
MYIDMVAGGDVVLYAATSMLTQRASVDVPVV